MHPGPWIDPTDPDALTQAELECERQAMDLFPVPEEHNSGLRESRLVGTPYQVGFVRGEPQSWGVVLTADDVLGGRIFRTPCRGAYPVDSTMLAQEYNGH